MFAIVRALRRKALIIICAHSNENVSGFGYFITSACAQKAKLTVNFLAFPSVKFPKIWQIGCKYFTLVGARFSGKSIGPAFFAAVKDIIMKKSKKNYLYKTLLFSCLKFVFHRRKFKKITNKKTVENTFVWAFYNSRLKPKILIEIIVKHHLIIAYYIRSHNRLWLLI